jgi:hypothetical protein
VARATTPRTLPRGPIFFVSAKTLVFLGPGPHSNATGRLLPRARAPIQISATPDASRFLAFNPGLTPVGRFRITRPSLRMGTDRLHEPVRSEAHAS